MDSLARQQSLPWGWGTHEAQVCTGLGCVTGEGKQCGRSFCLWHYLLCSKLLCLCKGGGQWGRVVLARRRAAPQV